MRYLTWIIFHSFSKLQIKKSKISIIISVSSMKYFTLSLEVAFMFFNFENDTYSVCDSVSKMKTVQSKCM